VHEPEPALIRAAAAGDRAAFERIVRDQQVHVWRFLRRLLGDATLAEDVAQETFLRVYTRLDTFNFEAKFTTWMFQIARNAGLDALRARDRRSRLSANAERVPVAPPTTPDVRVEVQAALDSLPPALRTALLMVEVLGLRYREVAEVLEVAEGTVKSRVFHARLRLHQWAVESEHEAAGCPAETVARSAGAVAPRRPGSNAAPGRREPGHALSAPPSTGTGTAHGERSPEPSTVAERHQRDAGTSPGRRRVPPERAGGTDDV
jgi:RNA polymerase sigma-70 factor, ECF subfamily